jgi:ribosomal protein S18 acetylase RimI-like enzyme
MPTHMSINRMTPADFGDVARLIETQNASPETQCLHSGEHAGEIEEVFRRQSSLHYVLMRTEGALVGAMGCELEDGRSYLHGPFVDSAAFAPIADDLWTALQMQLPAITRWDAFLNVRNERAATFYLAHGFRRGQGAQVYVMPATALQSLDNEPARRFTPDCADGVRTLHELAFADSPLSIDQFMNGTDDSRCLFICAEGSRCVGYVAASINDSPREGYIDLLAVDASVRNQGYGRRLLLTAAHWLIHERGMPQVGLTVRDMRADARQLYRRSGFELLYAGVGYSRETGTHKRS